MEKKKISEVCFRMQELEVLTPKLLENGFRVFGFQKEISQIFFENKDGIGTAHYSYTSNDLQFASVHKPSRENGTGFGLIWKNETALKMAEYACKTSYGHFSPVGVVIKWKNFEEKANKSLLAYFEITL